MKIYTRRGDSGETTLFGGEAVRKTDTRVAAYGTIDELNAVLGVVLALDPNDLLGTAGLADVQRDLFVIGARLAASRPERALRRGTIPDLDPGRTESLEAWIDRLDSELPDLDAFILPGGSRVAAQLHVARTICRRAERSVTALLDEQPALSGVILPFINRLSDLLFAMARWANEGSNVQDVRWLPGRDTGEKTEMSQESDR